MKQTVSVGNGTYENGDAPALLIVGHGGRTLAGRASFTTWSTWYAEETHL